MKHRSIVGALAFTSFAIVAAPRAAHAQVIDFASCPADLGVCDSDTSSCCVRSFDPIASARAIVIPMDRCHQVIAQGSALAAPESDASPRWCADPGPFSANDNGMYEAYGLVYRLMRAGIPVHWIINPTKDPPALTAAQNLNSQIYTARDIDAWVLSPGQAAPPTGNTSLATMTCGAGCVDPVRRLSAITLAPVADSYDRKAFPLRGGAFLIAPEDRARFTAFWTRTGEFAANAGNPAYDFSEVDLYEVNDGARFVYQDFRTVGPAYVFGGGGAGAPVAVRIDYDPPKLARLAPAGVSEVWLDMARLKYSAPYPACLEPGPLTGDAVYCDLSLTDIGNGALVSGGFNWVWIDNWGDNSPCSNATEIGEVDALRTFMTAVNGVRAGGHAVLMEKVIDVMEGCDGKELMGRVNVGLAIGNQAPNEPLILRYPHNLFMQWGDLPTSFAQGAVTKFTYFGSDATGYDPAHTDATTGTLVRLATEDRSAAGNTQCTNHKSTGTCDVFANSANADVTDIAAYLRFNDVPSNGVAFYMPGNQVNNGPSHLRMILNTLIAMPIATVPQRPDTQRFEVARAAPIIATVDGVAAAHGGTFTLLDPAPVIPTWLSDASSSTFEFPYTKGHFRAVTGGGTELWDAADHVPTSTASGCGSWFGSACRTIFTHTATGRNPARVYFSTANRNALGPLLGTQASGAALTDTQVDFLISHVLKGDFDASSGTYSAALGGVDRSTAAVIESSPTLEQTRPTMAYVGALDGMLHAICVDTVAPCTSRGQELWAFLPRVMLPRLRYNEGRIDGSPKVADVFGDFDANGTREWRTILTFQTGAGQAGVAGRVPAVYALDVTDPGNPTIVWEVAGPTTRGTFELGLGVGLAMAPVRTTTGTRNFTFVETSNGGTGNAGVYVAAIDTETGEVAWTWTHAYPAPRTGGNPPVPASAMPGGVASIDREGHGTSTHVAVPTLWGEVYLLSSSTGENAYGTNPLFQFSSDFHPIGAPPTIFRNTGGRLHAVVVSGGYIDPVDTSWSPSVQHQYAVGFSLDPVAGNLPITDTEPAGDRTFTVDLGAGQRSYGQPVVAGNELYVVSDSEDVNSESYGKNEDTGQLTRINLGTGTVIATVPIASGAAAVDALQGAVYSADHASVASSSLGGFDAGNEHQVAELVLTARAGSKLWLRLE